MHTKWHSSCLGIVEKIGSQFPQPQVMLVVHSTYASTINLRDSYGRLHSIVTKENAFHPASLLLNAPEGVFLLKAREICVGSMACVHEDGLFFDCGLWVSFLGAKRVPPSDESAPNVSALPQAILLRRELILDSFQKKKNTSLQYIHTTRSTEIEPLFAPRFYATIEDLSHHIRKQDISQSIESIQSLVGFGPGSTPSGDDFLCGLLLSWCMYSDKESPYHRFTMELVTLLGMLLKDHKHITTDISRMFLLLACDGLFSSSLLVLARSWDSREADNRQYREALTVLSEVGHSSGLDAAYGMVYGLVQTTLCVARKEVS